MSLQGYFIDKIFAGKLLRKLCRVFCLVNRFNVTIKAMATWYFPVYWRFSPYWKFHRSYGVDHTSKNAGNREYWILDLLICWPSKTSSTIKEYAINLLLIVLYDIWDQMSCPRRRLAWSCSPDSTKRQTILLDISTLNSSWPQRLMSVESCFRSL